MQQHAFNLPGSLQWQMSVQSQWHKNKNSFSINFLGAQHEPHLKKVSAAPSCKKRYITNSLDALTVAAYCVLWLYSTTIYMLVRCKKCGENTACIGIIRLHAQTTPLYLVGSEIPHQEATTRTESRNRMFLSFLSVYGNCRKDREALEWIKVLADFSQLFVGTQMKRQVPVVCKTGCGYQACVVSVKLQHCSLYLISFALPSPPYFFSRNWKFLSFKVDLTK